MHIVVFIMPLNISETFKTSFLGNMVTERFRDILSQRGGGWKREQHTKLLLNYPICRDGQLCRNLAHPKSDIQEVKDLKISVVVRCPEG